MKIKMRLYEARETVKEQFEDVFQAEEYDGSYHTPEAEEAERSFSRLTDGWLLWYAVHGDVKDPVARASFEPYPYWPELYQCCRKILKAHVDLGTRFYGGITLARLMGDAMALLRKTRDVNAPRWWLPIMKKLRDTED